MQESGIVEQTVTLEKSNRNSATHFALYNGTKLRYLIDLSGGKERLSKNISTYSKKLALLMRFMDTVPYSLLRLIGLGYFVKANLCLEAEKCRENTRKKNWNMIIGTYDEKQKVVLQCFNQNEPAVYIKIGNAATEKEMNAEIAFLQKKHNYQSFDLPKLIGSTRRVNGASFNIQITKEILGEKVQPVLNQEIVEIYRELSMDTNAGLEFSHGDFAPWNLRQNEKRYTLFDWEHCDYRIPGFDLMHYVVMVNIVLNGKNMSEAYDLGILEIQNIVPDFYIDKEQFLEEFKKLRPPILSGGKTNE